MSSQWFPTTKDQQQSMTSSATTEPASDQQNEQTAVHFDSESNTIVQSSGLPVHTTGSVRAIGSSLEKSFRSGSSTSGAIHLQRDSVLVGTQGYTKQGFVNGNFGAGKIRDLPVSGCHQMAFLDEAHLLAVGLSDSLAFYETETYSLVQSIERSDTVSAIRWLSLEKGSSSILVIAGLDGVVSLYGLDVEILEIQGPRLIHEFRVDGQVRALDCAIFGKLDPTLVVAVGDKSGRVTFASYRENLENIKIEVVEQFESGVLGLSLKGGVIVVSTKAGEVQSYGLRRDYDRAVCLDTNLWSTQRNGPTRSVVFSADGTQMAMGGYDKTLVLVNVELWKTNRELELEGTINTISFDPQGRYIAVGCRDKSFTLFDTSTFIAVKKIHTPGWVTSISWGKMDKARDIVAIRSEKTCLSILDLTPIHLTERRLSSRHGMESSISWSLDGRYVARAVGPSVVIADSLRNLEDIASCTMQGEVRRVVFCKALDHGDKIATIGAGGHLTVLYLHIEGSRVSLEQLHSVFVESHLKALAWSPDGAVLVTGGREKQLHVFSALTLKSKRKAVTLDARIWDIDFKPQTVSNDSFVSVALGDYTTVIFNSSFEPSLQVPRTRTVRCLKHHPLLPLLAVGDGAGLVAIVDYQSEELVQELEVGGRINVVEFSPSGDYLLIGTDDCHFSLHETTGYQCVQELDCEGFALCASFSPNGLYLTLGSASASYFLIRLGPFLSIDMVPLALQGGIDSLPTWASDEVLYRSGYGPSFVQRLMRKGGPENLNRVAAILRDHPDAIFAFDRETKNGCFNTALLLKRPNLLKLTVTTLVDGTLDSSKDGQRSILTTEIPEQGRLTLADMVENYPPEFVVDIFNAMTFMKVPFTKPRSTDQQKYLERGSTSYLDPWVTPTTTTRGLKREPSSSKVHSEFTREIITLTPAVLPIPGLGDMNFLSSLLANVPPRVFDNDAMAVVLRVMWREHIRVYFLLDTILFLAYFACWIVLVELTASAPTNGSYLGDNKVLAIASGTLALNSLFAAKEIIQSRFGRRTAYFYSAWNLVDLVSISCVYVYVAGAMIRIEGIDDMVPLAVLTSLLLTVKLLSYLRGLGETGWLVTVLVANFRDVRGFLIILFAILVGFSVSFRLLFGETGDASFGSLRRSFLSTFEMTIVGSYDPLLLFDAKYSVLAVMTFILAITCVLVVALNALISILADSYARVQEDATANRRKEQAELIVEYLALLPPWKRRQIERDTRWFHMLLEVDADGDLLVSKDDWQGGLNALRRDIEVISENGQENHQRQLQQVKADLDSELAGFKKEVIALLEDLSNDVKNLTQSNSQGVLPFRGQNVAKAVKAVKSIGRKGTSVFGKQDSK